VEYKPNDLFVGVLDFFGILVPGAVLMFLHGSALLALLGKPDLPGDKVFSWIGFLVASLLLGHFLTAIGVLLLNRAFSWPIGDVDRYYKEVEARIPLPVPSNRKSAFHRAYSYIRLKSAPGITEIDRQVAEYKLFRGLTVAFIIDFAFAVAAGDVRHVLVSAFVALFCWYRFASLVCWTQQMTFEYFALLTKTDQS